VTRIPLREREQVDGDVAGEWDRQVAAHGRMTHMKRTLAHSWPALRALMEWYPLEAEVRGFLGERLTTRFAHAVSVQADCLICSTFFRRVLIDAGEDPDRYHPSGWERTVVEFGRQLARDSNAVSDELHGALVERLTPEQIVALTAFGAMMIATNVFNNALRVELDGYLGPYAKAAAPGREGGGS
jgi:alkylhydroperoxidase family enzyme